MQSLQTLALVILRFCNDYPEMDNCVCRTQSGANTLRLASIHFEPFEHLNNQSFLHLTFNFSRKSQTSIPHFRATDWQKWPLYT